MIEHRPSGTRSVYLAVLRRTMPSPLAPESDEEKGADKNDKAADKDKDKDKDKAVAADDKSKAKPKNPKTRPRRRIRFSIDFDGISQRILALPMPARNYQGLLAGKEGELFLLEAPPDAGGEGPPSFTVQKFELKKRKTDKALDGVSAFIISANGEKTLYKQGEQWRIAPAGEPPKPDAGQLKLADMEVWVDPREEWKQMYHEVWRIERDFFYDPHFHGLDLRTAEKFYAPFWIAWRAATT